MTNGFAFDLAAISFGLFCGALAYLVRTFWGLTHHHRPFDWEIDAPEYRCAKDTHVRVVP